MPEETKSITLTKQQAAWIVEGLALRIGQLKQAAGEARWHRNDKQASELHEMTDDVIDLQNRVRM